MLERKINLIEVDTLLYQCMLSLSYRKRLLETFLNFIIN